MPRELPSFIHGVIDGGKSRSQVEQADTPDEGVGPDETPEAIAADAEATAKFDDNYPNIPQEEVLRRWTGQPISQDTAEKLRQIREAQNAQGVHVERVLHVVREDEGILTESGEGLNPEQIPLDEIRTIRSRVKRWGSAAYEIGLETLRLAKDRCSETYRDNNKSSPSPSPDPSSEDIPPDEEL